MIVRREPKYVRRRRIALLVVRRLPRADGAGVSRLVGALAGGDAAAAPALVASGARTAAPTPSAPTIPVPTRSPAEPQGAPGPSAETALVKVQRLTGDLAPKSVVASAQGLVFAQNMMYKHGERLPR